MPTGAEVRTMLEDIVGKVTAVWDKKLEKLEQENERLRAEVDRIKGFMGDASPKTAKVYRETMERLAQAEAEVERLRGAGE